MQSIRVKTKVYFGLNGPLFLSIQNIHAWLSVYKSMWMQKLLCTWQTFCEQGQSVDVYCCHISVKFLFKGTRNAPSRGFPYSVHKRTQCLVPSQGTMLTCITRDVPFQGNLHCIL